MKKYLESPIFSVVCLNDGVLMSCGGGGKRFGLTNYLILFPKPTQGTLTKELCTLGLGDEIYENMRLHSRTQQVVCNSEDHCVVLQIADMQIGEVGRVRSDFKPKEPMQNDGLLNPKADTLATGGEDGVLRIWAFDSFSKKYEINLGTPIQSLDYHITQPLLIAACDDFECKIINYATGTLIKKLSIAEKNVHQLRFRAALFSLDESSIITFMNPTRGASYMTVWRMHDDEITAVRTTKVHSQPITCVTQSREGMFLGVGTADGQVKIINSRYYDIESKGQAHEMVTKGIAFTPDSRYVISGSVDYTYHFLQNIRPEGWFSKITKVWFIALLIAYICTLLI